MQFAERSSRFVLLVAMAMAAALPAAAQMRPVDLEYAQNPAKRAADLKELKGLLAGVEKNYATAEASLKDGKNKEAAEGFVLVAGNAGRILTLYESLGFNFKNKNLGYPHYLIYKLESHLTGIKESKSASGATVRAPADPQAARILVYAGVLGRAGQSKPQVPDDPIEVEKLHKSAAKVMEFVREKIVAAKVVLE